MKVCSVSNYFSPYKIKLFNEIGKSVDLTAVILPGDDGNRNSEWNLPEEPRKTLLLVTDALGAFLASIKGKAEERLRIRELLGVESTDEFKILVQYWRKDGMHNDDTTMVVVTDEHHDEAFKRQEEWVW